MAGSGNTHTVVRLILVLVAALVLFALWAYYNRTRHSTERFSTQQGQQGQQAPTGYSRQLAQAGAPVSATPPQTVEHMSNGALGAPAPSEPLSNEQYRPVGPGPDGAALPRDPFPQDRISPEELLPRDAVDTKWAQVNPAGQGDVKDANFLTAGYHIGVDTQGQSLRNASHDIRSAPANPRFNVSIWGNSTIQPDLSRRPLE